MSKSGDGQSSFTVSSVITNPEFHWGITRFTDQIAASIRESTMAIFLLDLEFLGESSSAAQVPVRKFFCRVGSKLRPVAGVHGHPVIAVLHIALML